VTPLGTEITWGYFASAQEYYTALGYTYTEVPWVVPVSVVRATNVRHSVREWTTPNGALVGSAEQSFVHMALQGDLPLHGQYFAITPCFRVEPFIDEQHHSHFMKCELFMPVTVADDCDIRDVAEDALAFFQGLAHGVGTPEIVRTREGLDIMLNGIELGSYGYGEVPGTEVKWVYGTGLAEPRLSVALRSMA
jgi:hypothetical protein